MPPARSSSSSAAGFSNQQALLLLLITFPIGLIGIGLVITLTMRPQSPQVTQTSPAPVEQPAREDEPATIVESTNLVEPQPSTDKPLANQVSGNSNTDSNCWFQMENGGRLIGSRCNISQRVNANNDRVFDVVEPTGLKRSVVLWDNKEAEVFLNEQRYTGNWHVDEDGDVRVSLPAGTFAFKPPA